MNAAGAPGALAVDEVEGVVELGQPVEPAVGGEEARPIGVRREHRHRTDRRRTMAAAPGRVRRPAGGTGHAVPALGEPDDLPATGDDLGELEGRLVGLRPGRQQQHLRQPRCQPAERLGEVDHRPRQHPGEEVVEATDHLRHNRDDLGVRVPEDGAHLAAGEVEHPPPRSVLDEGAGRPLGHERRPRRPVPDQVVLGASEGGLVGHRPILVPPNAAAQTRRAQVGQYLCTPRAVHGARRLHVGTQSRDDVGIVRMAARQPRPPSSRVDRQRGP